MPRIRTLKPEAPQHRKVGRLSVPARWLWLVMITQADDEGRLVADPGQLRLAAFGYDQYVTDGKVTDWLAEIADTGLIRLYQIDGVPYADSPSWHDHQRINRPTPSKLPPYQESLSAQGLLSDHSLRTHAGSEGIGKEEFPQTTCEKRENALTKRPDPNERCPGCERVPQWEHGELDEEGDGLWWHSCVRAVAVEDERAVRRMLSETDLEASYLAECGCGHTIDNISEAEVAALRVETCEACGVPWTFTRYD